MPAESKPDLRLEIAHVLFIDIVGYSKLLINEQRESLEELNEVVRGTDAFRAAEAAGKLTRLPTGDGMALVFSTTPEAPVECALQISKALKGRPELRIRMGVHSGPVSGITDVNDRSNIAGGGINMAQRVMDCGDTGHILLSKRVAEDLVQYRNWQPHLHDLGECQVKHDVTVSVVNLYTDEAGNPALPAKFARTSVEPAVAAARQSQPRKKFPLIAVVALIAILLAAAAWFFARQNLSRPASVTTNTLSPVPNASGIPEKSIAVLPFENLSRDPDNAFFTDGVQDEILTDLARIADLKVISRTSVMQYKSGEPRNLREIGQQLGVARVVEGSVQRANNRVRVNAQLIDARNDAHLWAQTYDRDLADVFAIQSEIARAIADQVQAKISPREKAAMSQAPTTDLVANKLYAQAKGLGAGDDPNGKRNLLESVRLLNEAVARDPHFLLAYCLLAQAHLEIYWEGVDHTPARRDLASAAIQNAARLQPDAGEVHLALAVYAYHGFRDYDRARAELDRARSAFPNDADVYDLTGIIDRRQGRWTEATRNLERAVELDPLNVDLLSAAAATAGVLRRYPEETGLWERALKISPRDYAMRTQLALISFHERADTLPLHALISNVLNEEPGAGEKIAYGLFYCALAERDSAAVTRGLAGIPSDGMQVDSTFAFLAPREWFAGLAARTFGDSSVGQASFTAGRVTVEKIIRDQTDYAAAWSMLGLIDAGLARKDDAVREGRRACELLPVSRDALDGSALITNLAVIYAWTGEKNLALEQLAISAQLPAGVTYGSLKLLPYWDPLRGDPRFEKIVASLAPK